VCLAVFALCACQTSRSRDEAPMAAHPADAVQTTALAAPQPQSPPAEAQVAYVPVPPPGSAPPAPAPDGPVRIHGAAPTNVAHRGAPQAVRAGASDDRWEFLNWFGSSNTARRADNPAATLRLSHDSLASQESATDQAPQYPVTVDEGGRLRPSFTGDLPPPAGIDELTTESVGGSRHEPAVRATWSAPRRVQPSILSFAPGRASLDEAHRLELDRIADARQMDGGRIHVYGIARGAGGTRGQSAIRVRRLIERTGEVARYLNERGVPAGEIEIRTSEEQVPSRAFGGGRSPDRDRMEIFIE
jgi:outer membrane protein OmpA-like peptidoglycan-associated protein